mgnify:CR=1 FL=1
MPSLRIATKALFQLGPRPLALYGFYRLGLYTGHYRRGERQALGEARHYAALRPLLRLPARAELRATLGEPGLQALLEEADEIVDGRARLFGGESRPLRLTLNGPLRHWTEYETGRAPIPYADGGERDIKFVWEPARFGWALTLGRAYRAGGDERYAGAFWALFEEFCSANPPYLGPHWMNGQEVAIRLMALLWAAQLFDRAAASSEARRAALARSIAEHAARLPLTLVYARSQNNNHLISESAALYAAGVALGNESWQRAGWSDLNRAIRRQIGSYGEYIQHSTNYHRLMLEAALWVDAILRACGGGWPRPSAESLTRASHWLFSMLDPLSGRTPNLGANDGAHLLPLSGAAYDDYRPTVQAAARAFLRTGLPAGPWDELALWLGLPPSERTANSTAYMAEHLRGPRSWAYLRASRFPSRLSQMDQLHFDLWHDGCNIAPDAGTYLYNADPPWDNPLVSTRVHNTIMVDGEDQMTRGGRFLALDWFPAFSKRVLETDEHILGRMLAYHRGYRRLGIRHDRVATVFADERWEVRDTLALVRPGEHVFRLHWLLTDGEWSLREREAWIELHVVPPAGGGFTLRVKPDARIAYSEVRTSLVRAGELLHGRDAPRPFEGWVSPTYGVRQPALSLAVDLAASKSTGFVSEFVFD